jgi:hypothetical protein
MAVVVFQQTRSNSALLGIMTVIAITASLLLIERFWETPREAIERTLYELADAVEANDVPKTLTYLATNADPAIRSDVETLMPLVEIERANLIGTPVIELGPGDEPTTATAQVRGIIVARIKRNGMKGGQEDELTLSLVRQGDRWLVESYTSKRNWHRALGR